MHTLEHPQHVFYKIQCTTFVYSDDKWFHWRTMTLPWALGCKLLWHEYEPWKRRWADKVGPGKNITEIQPNSNGTWNWKLKTIKYHRKKKAHLADELTKLHTQKIKQQNVVVMGGLRIWPREVWREKGREVERHTLRAPENGRAWHEETRQPQPPKLRRGSHHKGSPVTRNHPTCPETARCALPSAVHSRCPRK